MGKKAAVSPEDEGAEAGYEPEAPPPGWSEDADEGPPELEEGANEEFLAASRKMRADALARRGQRRYNLAIRVVGGVVVFNMLACVVPLLDMSYSLSWATFSGDFSRYAINHWRLVDADAQNFAPYEHYRMNYARYDTSFYDGSVAQVSFVLLQPSQVPADRAGYCALVAATKAYAAANGDPVPFNEPWCRPGVVGSYAFLVLALACACGCAALWGLLLTGDGDVPPTRRVEYAPPDEDNPAGKHFVLTCYHAAYGHLLQAIWGIAGFDRWAQLFVSRYPSTNCGTDTCAQMGQQYAVSLGTVLVSLGCALFYRAIARQNHLYVLRRHLAAAKAGDTFGVLKTSGQAWFLPYIDDVDPDGSGKNAMHWAARKGSATMAQILVQSGADPRKRDASAWNAMHYCARYGHEQVMKNLLGSKFGAELVRSRECLGASPLHFCAAAGHLDCCLTLINSSGQPRVDASNAFGQTPLMLAASRGGKGTAVLDMLLTAGANPSVRDADGSTALHYAASAGSTYALERLLRAAYSEKLAPPGGRPRPAVTLQALHNRWGEAAADEAAARGKRRAQELLLANLDLFSVADRGRLQPYVPPHQAHGSHNNEGGGNGGGLAAVAEDEFGEFGDDDEGFEEEESNAASVAGWIVGSGEPEPEAEYPSDDERRRNDGAVLASVLRRRLTGQP